MNFFPIDEVFSDLNTRLMVRYRNRYFTITVKLKYAQCSAIEIKENFAIKFLSDQFKRPELIQLCIFFN